jgi:F420-non-reducing hydrogenase iron-sulfur subunit
MELLRRTLGQLGIETDRFRLDWVSASEGDRFSHIVNEMTEKVRALGPFKAKEEARVA